MQKTLQLPLYHFFGDEESSLCIDRIYVPKLRMFVPYLSVALGDQASIIDLPFMNKEGRVPYAVSLPRPAAKYGDWRDQVRMRQRSKMLWWRRCLPECSIKLQYMLAEEHGVRGYTSIKAIESGAVIRELRWICERTG